MASAIYDPRIFKLMNQQDKLAGRRYFEFDSSWPVLADQRSPYTIIDGGITMSHRSIGFNVLRGDGGVRFLTPADIIRGANRPEMLSSTVDIRKYPDTLPQDPRDDPTSWGHWFGSRSRSLASGNQFWNGVNGALK